MLITGGICVAIIIFAGWIVHWLMEKYNSLFIEQLQTREARRRQLELEQKEG
jgi:hypothetical protein